MSKAIIVILIISALFLYVLVTARRQIAICEIVACEINEKQCSRELCYYITEDLICNLEYYTCYKLNAVLNLDYRNQLYNQSVSYTYDNYPNICNRNTTKCYYDDRKPNSITLYPNGCKTTVGSLGLCSNPANPLKGYNIHMSEISNSSEILI